MSDSEDDASAIFKERLKRARDMREMSQQDLARKTGLPPSSISHFESGGRRPSFDNLRRLANALSVSTDFLIGRTDDKANEPALAAQKIYRNLDKLSAYDLSIADQFIEVLANKDRESKKE